MTQKTLFLFVLLIGCLTVFAQNDSPKSNCVNIELSTGKLSLQPLNQNTVRVRFTKGQAVPKEELIYTEDVASPAYKVKENNTSLKLSLEKMIVVYDKQRHKVQSFFQVKVSVRYYSLSLYMQETLHLLYRLILLSEQPVLW